MTDRVSRCVRTTEAQRALDRPRHENSAKQLPLRWRETEPVEVYDLHVHSTASDGGLSPEELVQFAVKIELGGIALTDHDTMKGIAAFMTCPVPAMFLKIPGIELTTSYRGRKAHLLGYFVKDRDGRITAVLSEMKQWRKVRIQKILEALPQAGIRNETIQRIRNARPEPNESDIVEALIHDGHVSTEEEATVSLLGPGCPAHVEKKRLPISDGIVLLRRDGAVPVLAHPLTLGLDDLGSALAELSGNGLLGVEVGYDYTYHGVTGTPQDVLEAARGLGLLHTGGTDFHSTDTSPLLGSIGVEQDTVKTLMRLANGYR